MDEIKENAIQTLIDIQRRIQGSENYGEVHAATQIVEFWNYNYDNIKIDEPTHFWIDFYSLLSSIRLIAQRYQTNHWGSIICARIGSFLSIYKTI